MCRFDSPCKANKPTGHETESTTRKRGRLPSNGLSSFRSRDVEHRHYVVCRRVHVAGLSASPTPAKAQRRNRPENTRGDRAREDFSNANFIPFPSSLVLPSLFFPHLRFLLPSFLPLSFQTAIPSNDPAGSSLRIVGQLELSRIIRARYRVLREGKNRREKERELMNSDRLLFDLVGRAR